MFKLFSSTQSNFLKNNLKTPKFLKPISFFHNPTKTQIPDSNLGVILNEVEDLHLSKPTKKESLSADRSLELAENSVEDNSTVQISHPWPEWVELMERLLKKRYFDDDPVPDAEMRAKDSNRIRTACLNFGRDRFDLIRYFSKKDIQVVLSYGCPSLDRKVVNSGKRLRAHVGLDEGNVCCSCSLRGDCERAYVKARDDGGRTVDVMRILLTYGLDPIIGSVDNKSCRNKTAKKSVKKLLKQMVNLSLKEVDSSNIPAVRPVNTSRQTSSLQQQLAPLEKNYTDIPMKHGDWICPKCNFVNFARNIRCLRCDGLFKERLMKLGENQDHLPLKKGDWLCDKCNFLNFAKNTRCLQCKENPPKRELSPGEWECDSCNYINFKRNSVCLKCDYRPRASRSPDSAQQREKLARVNVQPSDEIEHQNRKRGANMWRFVEDESYDDNTDSNSYNDDDDDDSLGFVDFPVKGGNTDLSQSKQKRERWKAEMADSNSTSRRNSNAKMKNGYEVHTGCLKRRPEFMESSDDDDDEEFAEWFGRGKKTVKTEALINKSE